MILLDSMGLLMCKVISEATHNLKFIRKMRLLNNYKGFSMAFSYVKKMFKHASDRTLVKKVSYTIECILYSTNGVSKKSLKNSYMYFSYRKIQNLELYLTVTDFNLTDE